jgi:hypothetical protein
MKLRVLLVAACVLGVVACGPNEEENNQTSAEAPGYNQLHQQIFEPQCSSGACHGNQGIAGLSFADPDTGYDQLLNGAVVNGPANTKGMKRVDPGNPDNSFLYKKLHTSAAELSEAGYGARMPLTGDKLGPGSLEAVRAWIAAGAPRDGRDFEADFVSPDDDIYVECDADTVQGLEDCFDPPASDEYERFYSPKITVPAGEEVIICSYLDYRAEGDLYIGSTSGQQMTGGHHSAVFVANSPQSDYEPHECGDEEMQNYRFIAAAGGGGGQDTEMPDGVALRIEDGQQIVIQSHYINTGDEAIDVMDAVDLELMEESEVDTIVDSFAVIRSDFEVPADAENHEVVKTCELEQDMDMYMLLGHTHDYGVLFDFELLRDGEDPELLYHATDGPLLRDNPEIKFFDPPRQLKAGDTLRMTCQWTNTTDHSLAWPEEMCVGLMYYGPGDGWLTCANEDEHPKKLGGGGGDGCADPSDAGNDIGVGKHCTANGSECDGNGQATICLAPFSDSSNFCSKLSCTEDSECGEGASCVQQSAGSACVPDKCL